MSCALLCIRMPCRACRTRASTRCCVSPCRAAVVSRCFFAASLLSVLCIFAALSFCVFACCLQSLRLCWFEFRSLCCFAALKWCPFPALSAQVFLLSQVGVCCFHECSSFIRTLPGLRSPETRRFPPTGNTWWPCWVSSVIHAPFSLRTRGGTRETQTLHRLLTRSNTTIT